MPFLSDYITEVYSNLTMRINTDAPIGLTTGIPALDETIGGGWGRQMLTYLVGDSGVGKSWLALSWMLAGARWLASNPDQRPVSGYILTGNEKSDTIKKLVADKVNKPPVIVFWSLEMAETPVTTRLISTLAYDLFGIRINSGQLLRGRLAGQKGSEEWNHEVEILRNLYTEIKEVYGQHIYVEFNARTISQFRRILDELAQAYDICLVVVDYFRLIQETAYDGNQATAQEQRSEKLRAIAKEYDCHLVSIFDINRQGQKAKSVEAYHMRWGVAANYDADCVLTVQDMSEDENPSEKKHLRIKVAKGRYVGPGHIDLLVDVGTGHAELWEKPGETLTGWAVDKGVDDDGY